MNCDQIKREAQIRSKAKWINEFEGKRNKTFFWDQETNYTSITIFE